MKNHNSIPCPVVAAVLLSAVAFFKTEAALPDLTSYAPAANPYVVYRTFAAGDCAVNEGCVQAGTRRLLAFTTQTRNEGAGDLILGNPQTNSAFIFDPCHNHYHYIGFAEYRLLDSSLNVVVVGKKIGFCLEDVLAWKPGANPNRRYDCNYQGIQAGWADVYLDQVPCQGIDITGVPGGNYTLEVEINPNHTIAESDYSNNIFRIPVVIPSECSPSLTNNNFANATSIPGSPFSFRTYNACATKEPGEPNHAGDAGGHSVWYQGRASSTSVVRLSTEGSDFDTLLAVYTGSNVSSLTLIASNDDIGAPTNKQSALSFNAVNGHLYYIAVDGYLGGYGTVVLNINPPLNDAFKNCQTLAGLRGRTNGYTIGATKQAGEPDHNGDFGGHSVWYCWTAPASEWFVFDTIGSDFDTLLAVYTGATVDGLTAVASDNDSGGNLTSRASFNAVAGRVYRIAVDGMAGATGNVILHWNPASRLSIKIVNFPTIGLTLQGAPGTYAIQWSSDRAQWTNLTTIVLGGSNQSYNDTTPGGSGRRFYRAVPMP